MVSSLSQLRQAYLDDILEVIEQVIGEEPDQSSLAEMGSYHLSTGGKRLRAILPLAVADALGRQPESVIPFSAACELLHNATLVHDDLQDGDRTRRDSETVWSKFGAERAINLGDAMLYWPLLACDRLSVSEAKRHHIIQRIVRSTLRVIDGQEREFLLQSKCLDGRASLSLEDDLDALLRDYIDMVEGKTGGLFALPLSGAADLCGADPEVVDALESSATHLGVLFQIQDDILDLYGEKGRDHRGADIKEGKVSALVVHHLNQTSPDSDRGAEWMLELLAADRNDVSLDDIDEVADAFRQSGAVARACQAIDRRRELAIQQPALRHYDGLNRLLEAVADLMLAPIDHVLDEYEQGNHHES
jgi:geranylgeranyl pyrophosphate synthase